MKHFAQLILGLAFIFLVGYLIYHFENPWWCLLALFLPSILASFNDGGDDDNNVDMI
jgi:hypothetical protein